MIAMKTSQLAVGYGKKTVVTNINLESMKGQIICLLGPNGAGKTTILRSLSGLLAPMGGAVEIQGKALSQMGKKEIARTLSVVLTKQTGCGLMTAFEVAAMGRHPYTNHFGKLSEADLLLVADALKTVNAQSLASRYFEELSDGEKQKVLVARALVQEPKLIILDEPTTHLDIKHRIELLEILKNLSKNRGITVILSLHEIDIALKSCDQVVLVKQGEIIGSGSPEQVINEAMINKLYDIKDANFNHLLGAIEMSNMGAPQVFVIGGAGTGIPVYRQLAKQGIGAATGVIHENDVDYEIARTMGIVIESEGPFERICEEKIQSAKKRIENLEIVIDAGAPIGAINQGNLELIYYAISCGKQVYSTRDSQALIDIFGDNSNYIKPMDMTFDLGRLAL